MNSFLTYRLTIYIHYNAEALYHVISAFSTDAVASMVALSAKQWGKYVLENLFNGGGALFSHISKEDKQCISVDLQDKPGQSRDPNVKKTNGLSPGPCH